MTIQFSPEVRNARLAAIPATIGASALLRVFSGSMPANTAAADTGTKLAEMALPSTYMGTPAAGAMAKAGTWEDLTADAGAATAAGYYRIYNTAGTVCHEQGTCTLTGGGGDMTFDGTFTAGQKVTITGHTLTEGNA